MFLSAWKPSHDIVGSLYRIGKQASYFELGQDVVAAKSLGVFAPVEDGFHTFADLVLQVGRTEHITPLDYVFDIESSL